MTAIGEALTAARGAQSLRVVAQRTAVSQSALSRYERGTRLPPIIPLYALAQHYGLNWEQTIALLAGDYAARVAGSGICVVPIGYQSHSEKGRKNDATH